MAAILTCFLWHPTAAATCAQRKEMGNGGDAQSGLKYSHTHRQFSHLNAHTIHTHTHTHTHTFLMSSLQSPLMATTQGCPSTIRATLLTMLLAGRFRAWGREGGQGKEKACQGQKAIHSDNPHSPFPHISHFSLIPLLSLPHPHPLSLTWEALRAVASESAEGTLSCGSQRKAAKSPSWVSL